MTTSQKEFITFQVKFVRNANHIKEVHKWLTETIEGEAEKIDKLIPKGASKFYLMTNVKGTAHLDVGSIDKVNKILEDNIKIPSICWLREDLSMLFEKDPVFKWSFPEILNGQDILNSVLFHNLNENTERRENVIKAYLADQYEMDNEVKFRQIDLYYFHSSTFFWQNNTFIINASPINNPLQRFTKYQNLNQIYNLKIQPTQNISQLPQFGLLRRNTLP